MPRASLLGCGPTSLAASLSNWAVGHVANWPIASVHRRSKLRSVSHFPRPDDPSNGPVIPETPRWQRRHSGVALMVALFGALGWAGWHYSHPAPPNGGAPPAIHRP